MRKNTSESNKGDQLGTDSFKTPEIDKNSDDYKKYVKSFDSQFKNDIDIKYLENLSRRLDNKFQVLVDFTKESESSNCDILLFKNVINHLSFHRNSKEIS